MFERMIYRRLGKTGLEVSLLSLGSGGARRLGQAIGFELKEQKALVRHAMALGVNLIDTAEDYGESEAILGECLRGIPRDQYMLSTKWIAREGDAFISDPQALLTSVEGSLKRLNTDYVDVMFFHGPLPSEYDQLVDCLYPAMERLKEAGKIRYVGLSTRFVKDPAQEVARLALAQHPELWDVLMLKYGILNQFAAKTIFPMVAKHDVGIMNMAAVRIKLPDPELLRATILDWKIKNLVAVNALPEHDPLGWLVHDDVLSVIEAGYRFAAEPKLISTVISGTSSIAHLDANARSLERPGLSESDSRQLKELFGEIIEYA
ncbi:MAG: aldo/keto reductase [Opitutales bacterium]|nr:aldo/keto reductase [Opitutales bacterium]